MENKKQNLIRTGIVYVRVSSLEQTHGTSLESQKEACLEYARRQEIEIPESAIFVERGESATAANRTELIKALEYCRVHKGQTNAFIVWKVDRFARNQTDHFALRARLAEYGVRLHSVTEPISDDPIGKMTEGMLAAYAQFENEIRKQRCEGGMQRKVEQGIWPWMPPIGYINAKKLTDRRKTRADEPDPDRFYHIQKALKTYATGKYAGVEVCRMMNQWGFKTRTGQPMRKQLMERVLRDPFYAGVLVNPWNSEKHKGQHVPMISWEEFEQIQAIKQGLSRHLNRPRLTLNPDFPLRRFVTCPCGRPLTASWHQGRNKKHAYYHCQAKGCPHKDKGILKDNLENKFVELLLDIAPREDFLGVFEEIVLDVWRGRNVAFKQDRVKYEGEIKKLEMRKERLTQMRMNGEITQEEFMNHKNSIDNQITGIKISQNESRTDELDMEAVVSYGTQFIRNVAKQWQEMNIKQRQRLQKLVYPEGIVYDKTAGSYGTAVLSPVFLLSRTFTGAKSELVAEAGIAPASQGYEPREVLLLHPAK